MSKLNELERLAQLHRGGSLTDEEFGRAKQRLLREPSGASRSRGPLPIAIGALIVVTGVVAYIVGSQLRTSPADISALQTPPNDPSASTLADSAPPSPAQKAGLTQVFQRSMIGAQVAYLERVTGPARDVSGASRIYVVDGCEVSATIVQNKVTALGLPVLSPRCTVSLSGFGFEGPLPHKATFGQFQDAGFRTRYTADCLRSCGNAYDPSVYATVETPHSNGFIAFRVGSVQTSEEALDAAEKWESVMEAEQGEDWLIAGEFNCTERYDPAASRIFKQVRITSFEVGNFLETRECT